MLSCVVSLPMMPGCIHPVITPSPSVKDWVRGQFPSSSSHSHTRIRTSNSHIISIGTLICAHNYTLNRTENERDRRSPSNVGTSGQRRKKTFTRLALSSGETSAPYVGVWVSDCLKHLTLVISWKYKNSRKEISLLRNESDSSACLGMFLIKCISHFPSRPPCN